LRFLAPFPLLTAIAVLFVFGLGPAAAAEEVKWRILGTAVPAGIESVSRDGPRAIVADFKGRRFAVTTKGGKLTLNPAAPNPSPAPKRPSGILPDCIVSTGLKNIRAAWLTGAIERYDHGVLGDAIEARGVAVELSDGRRLELLLDLNSVFEDRLARIADVDGDGEDEVLAVLSYLDAGAALVIIKPEGNSLRIVAETTSIGIPNRWLNPIGVADFDADGRPEVAMVTTPHIGGILKIYAFDRSDLKLERTSRGYSNHTTGERELGKAAIVDANRDGTPDLALPNAWQRTLRVVTFKGGRFAELARIGHDGESIVTAIVAADVDGDGREEVVYGLSNGRIVAVHFIP
jgi:hypothetical protein